MDFTWSAEETFTYERAIEFGKTLDQAPRASWGERWRACASFGLAGLSVPAELGGSGFDALSTAHVLEGFGRGTHDLGIGFSTAAHLFACTMPLLEFGGHERRPLVLRLARGESIGANAITEAEAGSDVFSLRTTAERCGNEYRLNGVKSFVTNGPVADVFLVYATINRKDGYLGVTAFLVERGAPGVVVGEQFEKMGLAAAPMSSVYLEDVRVPVENRVGEEGRGSEVFGRSMLWERACLFALYLGSMQRQTEESVEFAKRRRQGGRPISAYQAVSHRLVDMKARLEAARLLLYRACWAFDRGQDAREFIGLAKIAISEGAVQTALDAIQIHGGSGYLAESRFEASLRDAIPTTIFSGTSEVQRNLVARSMGL